MPGGGAGETITTMRPLLTSLESGPDRFRPFSTHARRTAITLWGCILASFFPISSFPVLSMGMEMEDWVREDRHGDFSSRSVARTDRLT